MVAWSVIVITCPSASFAVHVEAEVEYLKRKKRIPHHVTVLCVEDPAENIGSGAATLNALLVATEYLSVQSNYSVVNSDVLSNAKILILHQGRQCVYSGCLKSFLTLPGLWHPNQDSHVNERHASGVYTNLEMLLQVIEKLSVHSPPGVWVCSTDMTLLITKQELNIDWSKVADVLMFCVPADVKYATDHGCVAVNDEGYVTNIVYAGSQDMIQRYVCSDGNVLIISGIVFITPPVAENLLAFHLQSPLESCTYIGLDSGAEPVQVSLFFDILMSMALEIREKEFIDGHYGKTYNIKFGYSSECARKMTLARSLIWKTLSRFKMTAEVLCDCLHLYWSDHLPAKMYLHNLFTMAQKKKIHSILNVQGHSSPDDHLLVNSILDVGGDCSLSSNVAVINSKLKLSELFVEEGSCVSGLSTDVCKLDAMNIPKDTIVIGCPISNDIVIVTFGTSDKLLLPIDDPSSTFANKPFSDLLTKLGIDESALWEQTLVQSKRTLMTAKLFVPFSEFNKFLFLTSSNHNQQDLLRWKSCRKFSIADILQYIDCSSLMNARRSIYMEIAVQKIEEVLLQNEDCSLISYFFTSFAEGWSGLLMETLDSILVNERNTVVLTRTLSCMADLLALMAGENGGLRTGPGSNKSWLTAFELLQNLNLELGMKELILEREKWMDRPSHMMRAARHFERAAQILIQNSVKSAKKYLTFQSKPQPAVGSWVMAKCPARIDLQGGWTDTPPICYELGGSVVNVAILVDGKMPIGARACRKAELNVELMFGSKDTSTTVVIRDLNEILDYDQPYATGALLKAALICSNIIDPSSNLSLQEQLQITCRSGLILQSWSDLPQGCGLGASSILAGAVIAVLWHVSGKSFDKAAVIHAVLCVEQLLTTGGGWQDQVGGIFGGVNRGFCEASLPLYVRNDPIPVPKIFLEKLEQHLLLIYTGKVRLAKNILQTVIRNWYARDEVVVNCFKSLISSSIEMENALKSGDFAEIGALMNRYWEQKKILAPGCEPASVRKIMDTLKPFCHGQILTGAGGGGFMCILTKEPDAKESIKRLLPNDMETQITMHTISVCHDGMVITM